MIHLNYNNLDAETQEHLLTKSKMEISKKYGEELQSYSNENQLEYDVLLEEEAIRNLYNYKFAFSIWALIELFYPKNYNQRCRLQSRVIL